MSKRYKRNKERAADRGVGACLDCESDSQTQACTPSTQFLKDAKCRHQRIPFTAQLAAAPGAGQYTEATITPNHNGMFFEPERLSSEAFNSAGDDVRQVYWNRWTINQDVQDCMAADEARGVPVNSYSEENCCDGKPVCIRPFRDASERNALKMTVRNYELEAVTVQGYLVGRCKDCGYESH